MLDTRPSLKKKFSLLNEGFGWWEGDLASSRRAQGSKLYVVDDELYHNLNGRICITGLH